MTLPVPRAASKANHGSGADEGSLALPTDNRAAKLFGDDIHDLAEVLLQQSEEELWASWRMFTKLKDHVREGKRLENASWRLAHDDRAKQRRKNKVDKQRTSSDASGSSGSQPTSVVPAKDFAEGPDMSESMGELFGNLHRTLGSAASLRSRSSSSDFSATTTSSRSSESGEEVDDAQLVLDKRPHKHRRGKGTKCAFFSHSMQRNGANMCLLHLCNWLCGEMDVDLVSPKDGPMRADFEAVGVKCMSISPSADDYLQQIEEHLKQAGYAVVICNTIMRAEVAVVAETMGIPCVWVVHEAWPKEQFEYYAKEVFLMDHIDSELLHKAFSMATRIIFPANVQKNLYGGLYKEGAALCIYNGIPLDALDEFVANRDREEVRFSMGYQPEDFLIVQVGTVCKRKGQLYTAKAFARLVEGGKHPDARLLMVGARYIRDHEIKYIDEIKAVLAEHGLQDRVKILDCQDEVFQFYLAADIVLQPSLNEVLPLCICEAMAFHRPIIASAIDGIPESLDNGVEGLLIPPADEVALEEAISSLIDNPEERVRLGKNGRARVEKQFSYHNMIGQYKDFITSIVSQAAPAVEKPRRMKCIKEKGEQRDFTVLVDMDNTVVDWDKEFTKRWLAAGHPESDVDIIKNRQHFEIEKNFEPERQAEVVKVIAQPGLYASLEPFPGAVEALQDMIKAGFDVKLVTAPHPACLATCTAEKYDWVARHLGEQWHRRLVITMDKTCVQGSILVDDKPAIKGSMKPRWKHVVFSAPYNNNITSRQRLHSWKDWESVITPGSQRKAASA